MRHLRSSVNRLFKTVKEFVSVSADFYVAAAAGILILPLPWLGAWMLSACVHELCHYIALKYCGCRVTAINISIKGVFMETDGLTVGKEAFCAYAGPVGPLLLLLFANQIPRTCICIFLQSLYNLLPVFPLDGGRGLGCALQKVFGEEKGKRAFRVVELVVLCLLMAVALYAMLNLGLGFLPCLLVISLIIKNKKINIPCKKRPLVLQ